MTKLKTLKYKNLPTIAYWSALGGVEVKQIEYGIEDYVVCIVNAWSGKSSVHRVKINYTHTKNPRDYIIVCGTRLYFDECIRERM